MKTKDSKSYGEYVEITVPTQEVKNTHHTMGGEIWYN